MEQQEIEVKLPGLYTFLASKDLTNENWTQVYNDLTDLSWLNHESCLESSVILGIISISDRLGKAFLSESTFFMTFDLNSVKIFINDAFYKIIKQKKKLKELCLTSKKLINNMDYFQKCKSLIGESNEQEVYSSCEKVHDSYKILKKIFVVVTLQLERYIQNEFDKSFGEILDEIFFTEVLQPSKAKLKSNETTSALYSHYKPSQNSSSTKYSTTYFSSYNKYENVYIGEVNFSNQKHGYGKMYYSTKDFYAGNWENDKPHGKGLYIWKEGSKYLGDFSRGQMHGFGKKYYNEGNYYEGEFFHGKRSGKGLMKFKNGDEYNGEWSSEEMHGKGMYKWASGDFFIGEFKRDKREGKGTLTLSTGEVYEAEWEKGNMKKED